MTSREKGLNMASCATCGTKLAQYTQPDGATAVESCPKCFGPEPERAAERPSSGRERGTSNQENRDA